VVPRERGEKKKSLQKMKIGFCHKMNGIYEFEYFMPSSKVAHKKVFTRENMNK
jgi:hypothetical protein